MKNYYYDLQNFHRALRRNDVKKVFLHGSEFWFYTRKGVISYDAIYKDSVDKFQVWLVTHGVEVDVREDIR